MDAAAPFPANVRAFTTLRHGAGASQAPFDTFNLGNFRAADGDDADVVARNRAELVERFGLPSAPHWLHQVHGIDVVRFDAPALPPPQPSPVNGGGGESGQDENPWRVMHPPPLAGEGWGGGEPVADAAVTSVPGVVLAILTADCLPVVFASKCGDEIAAAHAGWPGLSKGMLEATLAAMRTSASDVLAWIGPAAGPSRYEVGREVFDAFVAHDAGAATCFVPTREGHWLADLPALARRRLVAAGMSAGDIRGGDLCTLSDPARFFSHRRDGRSGRMATIAWLA
ncbi:peptidoglycan editing factor PgeF [Luteimonas aestuarii]|uniref:peptidoglycan editing factor PgeF n=1 Tax=Luteimonas aestuarii TaxID=453837 RepID=UPI003CE468F9